MTIPQKLSNLEWSLVPKEALEDPFGHSSFGRCKSPKFVLCSCEGPRIAWYDLRVRIRPLVRDTRDS